MIIILIIAVILETLLLSAAVVWSVLLKSRLDLYSEACPPDSPDEEPEDSSREERERLRLKAAARKLVDQKEELEKCREQLQSARTRTATLQDELVREQEHSARLLLNVLPANIVNELKTTGTSKPKSFDEVTVFVSDIVDFTRKSSFMDTDVVFRELNMIFTEFDRIFKDHDCERIKTIGDAYMAVSGMDNTSDPRQAINMLKAALEAMAYVRKLEAENPYHWQMRMGVHTGRVVGGIVGSDKYIYDVFGDTINVASRMEHASEPMQINVSEATYALTRDEFSFIARGQIETKGKGFVNMYFLKDIYDGNTTSLTEELPRW